MDEETKVAAVKITNEERKKRILSSQKTIDGFIEHACKYFKLSTTEKYKLVVEQDGTDIEDFDALFYLAKENKTPLIMILPEDRDWEDTKDENLPRKEKKKDSTSLNTESLSPASTEKNSSVTIQALPWGQVVPKNFKNQKNNSTSDENDFIRNLAAYQMDVLQSDHWNLSLDIAEKVVAKFPLAFSTFNWKGEIENTGAKALRKRINDRIKTKQKSITPKSQGNTNENAKIKKYGTVKDEFGCVGYEPSLPEGETAESQEEAKKELLRDFQDKNLDEKKRTKLMNDTYATQRVIINHRKTENLSVSDIVSSHWPHLSNLKYFFAHASILIGKEVLEEWQKNLEERVNKIHKYFEMECHSKKNKKGCSKQIKDIYEHLEKSAEVSKDLRGNTPKIIGLIQALSVYFGEESIFEIMDVDASEEDLQEKGSSDRPTLIVKGNSIYNETVECFLYLEKSVVVDAIDSVINGTLVFILVHFVYGINYKVDYFNTLEFMQRMFLDIYPIENRKGPKTDAKVTTLIRKIMKTL